MQSIQALNPGSMKAIQIKPITVVRDDIYSEVVAPGLTAITRHGRFAGVLISAGHLPGDQSGRWLAAVRHNPEHTIGQLTRKAIR